MRTDLIKSNSPGPSKFITWPGGKSDADIEDAQLLPLRCRVHFRWMRIVAYDLRFV
jgi:hypothetical protein